MGGSAQEVSTSGTALSAMADPSTRFSLRPDTDDAFVQQRSSISWLRGPLPSFNPDLSNSLSADGGNIVCDVMAMPQAPNAPAPDDGSWMAEPDSAPDDDGAWMANVDIPAAEAEQSSQQPVLNQYLSNLTPATASSWVVERFERFLKSADCVPLLGAVVSEGSKMSVQSRKDLIWSIYDVADDVAEFLFAFAGAAETYPASIVVSDMDMAGAPMIFVNRQFCKMSGYSKEEVTGRNC